MSDTESPRSRWTPEVVIGLLVLLASLVLPYLDVPPGVSTACGLFAAWLLGPLPSPLTPRPPDQRGHARGSLLVALLALGLGLLGAALLVSSAGCSLLERRRVDCTTPPESVLEDMPDGTCVQRGFCDGHELWTATGPGPCGEIEERRAPAPAP